MESNYVRITFLRDLPGHFIQHVAQVVTFFYLYVDVHNVYGGMLKVSGLQIQKSSPFTIPQ